MEIEKNKNTHNNYNKKNIKNYYIRFVNKIRRKLTSIINKISNNKEINEVIYKDYLFKFQQIDNTMTLLESQINDLNNIYYQIKNDIDNDINYNNKNNSDTKNTFKPLTKSEMDILLPIFLSYYSNSNSNLDTNLNTDITTDINQVD